MSSTVVCMYVPVCMYMYICTGMYVPVCMYVCMYRYVCTGMYVPVCMYVCTGMYVCMYVQESVIESINNNFMKFDVLFKGKYRLCSEDVKKCTRFVI